MIIKELKNFVQNIVGYSVNIYETVLNENYSYNLINDFEVLQPDTKYNIAFDGGIQYTYKTGKNEDNFLKTFLTQHINKYETKRLLFDKVAGELREYTKTEVIEKLRENQRVTNGIFYTTQYGIGFFIFLMSDKSQSNNIEIMANHLKGLGVEFKNEYSEARWVYRFVINKSAVEHDTILKAFKNE